MTANPLLRRPAGRLAAGIALLGVALLAAAYFGYWVGRPGGIDFFGGPAAPASPTPPATPAGTPASPGPSVNPLPDPPSLEPPPVDPALGYRVSGYRPQAIDQPFVTRNEATGRTVELDADGGLVYRMSEGADPLFQPVTISQWAMSAHTQYWLTGHDLWLDLARASAEKLLDGKVEADGAYFYPYLYEWKNADYGFDFQPPWYSGMAQGEALSVFVQLAQEFPDQPVWREAADATFESFLAPVSAEQPWVTRVEDGYVWFEEYADPDPFQVFNGQVFALFGIYEYALLTGDQRAVDLFDGGATTALAAMPQLRVPGETSLYCVELERCVEAKWQNSNYQSIHVAQLEMLAAMTGDAAFAHWAQALRSDVSDFTPWPPAEYWPKPDERL
ncbi:MAG: D-glucuronyl C5-epimerase family protein [Bifidobacteriaceae bacterium]|nr:D-glucuronyl C5-epimerase family protein [Bifidobacteriaceae bacterium]